MEKSKLLHVYHLNFLFLATLQSEKLLSQNLISPSLSSVLHYIILLLSFVLPVSLSHPVEDLDGLMVSLYTTLVYLVLALKMISYVSVNKNMREVVMKSNNNCDEAKIYPSNLTLKNMFIFWSSPSLVYSPASLANSVTSKRYSYIVYRFFELFSLLLLVRIPFMMLSDVTMTLLNLLKMDSGFTLLAMERFGKLLL